MEEEPQEKEERKENGVYRCRESKGREVEGRGRENFKIYDILVLGKTHFLKIVLQFPITVHCL